MDWFKRITDCAKNKDLIKISSKDKEFGLFKEQYEKFCDMYYSNSILTEGKDEKEIYSMILDGINILNNVWINVDIIPLNDGFSPYSLISNLTIPINKYIYEYGENLAIRKIWNDKLYSLAIERKDSWFVQLQNMLIKANDQVPTELLFVIYNCEKMLTDIGKCFQSEVFDEFRRLTEDKYQIDRINILERYAFCTSSYSKYKNQISYNSARKRNVKMLKSDIRQAEDNIRESLKLPGVGKGWISESVLFREIQQAFPEFKVLHHARPSFLGKQHYDIYIPQIKTAIEYQGIQHSRPVDYFGGANAWLQILERDQRKKQRSEENGIRIIYVYPDYCLEDVLNEIDESIPTTYQKDSRLYYIDSEKIEEYRAQLQYAVRNLKTNSSLLMKQKEYKEKKRAVETERWKQFYHYDELPEFCIENETKDTLIQKQNLMKHYKQFDIPLEVCNTWSLQIRRMLRNPRITKKLHVDKNNLNWYYSNLITFHKKLKEYDTCIEICREALSLGLPGDDKLEMMTNVYGIYHAHNYKEIIKEMISMKSSMN